MNRATLQKNLPPLVGLVAMVLAGIVLRRFFVLAIPVGLLVWWLSHLALTWGLGNSAGAARRRRVQRLPDARTRQDMSQALAKVETLKSLNGQIPDRRVTAALDALADQAAFLIDEAVRTPSRANVTHKPLALYLGDAVELSQRFADLQRFKAMPADEIDKTATSLEHLVTLFKTYAARMRTRESEELDIKITVLEARLREEGIFDR